MDTKVITLATSKGGTGKSTMVRNLAAYWYSLGLKILIIDADPQGSIINRDTTNNELNNLKIIAEPEETVSNVIDDNIGLYNYIIVDTGGFRNKTTVMALLKTNIVIIPLKPSADDVAGAVETYSLVRDLNKTPERFVNPIKYRMLITMSQQNTIIAKHIRSELESLGYFILKSELYHRVAYPESVINGLSPCISDPDGPAARDISNIIKDLSSIL